jgi:hypothetical protein
MWSIAFLRKSGGKCDRGGAADRHKSVVRAAKRSLGACAPAHRLAFLRLFSVPLVLPFRRAASAKTGRRARDQWRTTWRRVRALSILITLALALLTTTSPAAAYVIEALTSISADLAADKATLEKAIQAAVVDVATHAVAFTPTIVSLRGAKLVGGRIYLFVLLADAAGEAELEMMGAASARRSLDPR